MGTIKKLVTFGVTAITTFAYLTYLDRKGVPDSNGGFRAGHRADGRPKVDLGSPNMARLQAVMQFIEHGEKCVPYRNGKQFHTGHLPNCDTKEWFKKVAL